LLRYAIAADYADYAIDIIAAIIDIDIRCYVTEDTRDMMPAMPPLPCLPLRYDTIIAAATR